MTFWKNLRGSLSLLFLIVCLKTQVNAVEFSTKMKSKTVKRTKYKSFLNYIVATEKEETENQ